MAVNKIASIDIKNLDKDQSFAIDTNILFFIHSGYYKSSINSKKNKTYSDFVEKLIKNGNKLVVSAANLQELFHKIEDLEFNKYCKMNGLNNENQSGSDVIKFTKKDFRADATLRKSIQNKIQTTYMEISLIYKFLDCTITMKECDDFLIDYNNHRYDPIDYFMVKNMLDDSYVNFVTDDSDFTFDSKINVFIM